MPSAPLRSLVMLIVLVSLVVSRSRSRWWWRRRSRPLRPALAHGARSARRACRARRASGVRAVAAPGLVIVGGGVVDAVRSASRRA
ncbi:hypothetical protein PF010_g17867 [Phytophthora fragariae]|uniref:RxLR effector protein n=1 Tax=Phytophthora fragariae TaxID=53985 RepID=A0A6A3JKA5_9STRA|nr:hypothetical protein PF011_g17383 [Phytophthora fragariae]KAE9092279.1 hypothetical protein PF010_g17867 [Phytophthora fragariae]